MTRLQTIARSVEAKRILEVGTGDGSATVQLASVLPPDGMVITMEADPSVAARAREQFAAAGDGHRISVIVGLPSRFLHKVSGPFDVVFENGESGLPRDRLLALIRAGGVLIRANTKYISEGHITEGHSEEEGGDALLSIQVKA
jgi:predicted O-methyltransferase YrrM